MAKRRSTPGTRGKSKKAGLDTSKIILYAAGTGAILGTTYIGYNFLRDLNIGQGIKKITSSAAAESPAATQSPTTTGTSLAKPTYHEAFPLKVGDKNWYVQQLQLALIRHGGKAAEKINSSGGADGIFGQGTLDALMAAGYKSMIEIFLGGEVDAQQYERILNKGSLSGLSGYSIAPPVAVTTRQTYLITAETINRQEPEAYPVMEGVTIGYLLDEKDGLARIQTEKGDIFYTVSTSIKAL
jgi:hypothetical protein